MKNLGYRTILLFLLSMSSAAMVAQDVPQQGGARLSGELARVVRSLDSVPGFDELVLSRGQPLELKAHLDRIMSGMWAIGSASTGTLRAALHYVYARRLGVKKALSGDWSLEDLLSRYPDIPRQQQDESIDRYLRRLDVMSLRAVQSEIYVNRFLFYALRISGPPFRTPQTGDSYGDDDRVSPFEIIGDVARILPSQLVKEKSEPSAPDEFEFYVKHFPRRDWRGLKPDQHYEQVKSIVGLLDQCPTPTGDWMEDHSSNQAQVEKAMRALADRSTEELRSALKWLVRRMLAASMIQDQFPLEEYLLLFPLNPARFEGESEVDYIDRLRQHAKNAVEVEMWIDRFLFDAPEVDVVEQVPVPRSFTRETKAAVWFPTRDDKHMIGDRINRMYPVKFDGQRFRIEPLAPYWWSGYPPSGAEFDYYAMRFKRRLPW